MASLRPPGPNPRPFTAPLALALGLGALAGCGGGSSGGAGTGGGSGGGGGGGAVAALNAPSQLSVVTTDETVGASALAPGATVSGLPADSHFHTDRTSVYVYDPSMEALETVNMILCFIGKTGYDGMLNQGPYLALVDESDCEQGSNQGSEAEETGQSAGADAIAPNLWTLESTRTSNSSNHVMKLWAPQDDEDIGSGTIHGKVVIREGASDELPFGNFVLNFARVPDGRTEDDASLFGTLRTTETEDGLGFQFFETFGDVDVDPGPGGFARRVQVNVQMSTDQTTGVARIVTTERFNFPPGGDSGPQQTEYLLAFDEDHVLRSKDGAAGVCLSRDSFLDNVWRYNLYDATTGERVELSSGFSVRTDDGHFGYIGYHGLWLPDEVPLVDGMTLTREHFDGSEAEVYTLRVAPGKLIERSQNELLLTEIDGQTFQLYEHDSMTDEFALNLVEYTGGAFFRVAAFDEETQTFEPLDGGPEAVDTESLGILKMWSQSLGGEVTFFHGDTHITYYSEQFVNGSHEVFGESDQIELFGYIDSLRSGLTTEEVEAGDIFLPQQEDVEMPHRFVFDRTTLTLFHDPDGTGENLVEVGLAEGEEAADEGPFFWGFRSGPMVVDTSGLSDVHELWGASTSYVYETGPHHWNQYAVVVDEDGDTVTFDPPVEFPYTHSQADDANDDPTFDGEVFLLHYGGPGDLGGIPDQGSDLDGDGNDDRWYSLFAIANGTLMGPTGTEYAIRAIEVERRLSEDPGGCGDLDLSSVGSLEIPDETAYQAPDIGPAPEVDDPPAVIDGEVLVDLE